MRQAIGYIRVSTLEQANEGISLEAQQARIERWCEANDYQLAALYVDRGISGKRMDNRKDLQRALAALKKDMVLVVHSLSRLARSTKDALHLCDLIGKKKADLVSLSESLDTTTALRSSSLPYFECNNLTFRYMAPITTGRHSRGRKNTNSLRLALS